MQAPGRRGWGIQEGVKANVGYRYLYLYLKAKQQVHLLILLDKNEQGNATGEQRRAMREMVAAIKKAGDG